ncbi:hypothetical protein M405DRAFT_832717 [Rhizopogon salebrosus TDB-379]|nr:hypothetical protein M405DRAFT_832717 [Rhizopogon salebrosus TDB-379]
MQQLTQTESARPAPVDTDLLMNEDRTKSDMTREEHAVLSDRDLAENMPHILDVLEGSTIAEERGKDIESRFWATYKKVSNEYDDDFLERGNDDMAIILTFTTWTGVFSTGNSTFIVGMQPNPGLRRHHQCPHGSADQDRS